MDVVSKGLRKFQDGRVVVWARSEQDAREHVLKIRDEAQLKVYSPADFILEDFDQVFEAEDGWRSFVYVMQCEPGPVKIGFSDLPSERIFGVQTGNPYEIQLEAIVKFNRGAKLESRTHKVLADKRMCGEWFDVTPLEAVAAIQEAASQIPCLVLPHFESPSALACSIGQMRDLGYHPW